MQYPDEEAHCCDWLRRVRSEAHGMPVNARRYVSNLHLVRRPLDVGTSLRPGPNHPSAKCAERNANSARFVQYGPRRSLTTIPRTLCRKLSSFRQAVMRQPHASTVSDTEAESEIGLLFAFTYRAQPVPESSARFWHPGLRRNAKRSSRTADCGGLCPHQTPDPNTRSRPDS